MVGKPGGQPPPSAAKAFNSAAAEKPRQLARIVKSTDQGAKMMSPSPGGTSGGWSPPLGAKAAADRKKFAQQLAEAKARAEPTAKAASEKPKTASKEFNAKANSGRAKTSFNSTASNGQNRAAFNAASKSSGKGGRTR